MRVFQGAAGGEMRRPTAIESAYDHFRLERQGNLVSAGTLSHYDYLVRPFFDWLRGVHPEVVRFEDLGVAVVRQYRAELAARVGRHGRTLQPATLLDSHRLLATFLSWAEAEGYPVDPRILKLKAPRVPLKEPTVYHIASLRKVLAVCSSEFPQEELAVRILVGSGVRASELCGLAVQGPDGLPDVMLDSLVRGRVELRVRWDGGAKGLKSRRVPITPKLAAAVKRYEARQRRDAGAASLLVSERGGSYTRWGVREMMERLGGRVGFRVHAHAFRHTFATVATKLGWNFEHLRAAMGHADYAMLQRYVRLASERDLGPLKEWAEFIVEKPAAG
jgi:integrase/recombinase XerD